MKTKVIFIQLILFTFFGQNSISQTAAVANLNTNGVGMTPELAGKLTRIELINTEKYIVLDEFDMESGIEQIEDYSSCYGKQCLTALGQALKVDYIFSGSIHALGNKIVVHLKMIDIKSKSVHKTNTLEFDNQTQEISRMVEITLGEMLEIPVNEETKKRLLFKDEVITSTNVGRVNNSGPRFGVAVPGGGLYDFFTRNEREGGLGIIPATTNIGYQFEVQYIGTENFSALFEVIPNVAGMEQGQFIPTLNVLNGFRFGQSGWEFAFGPSFGGRRILEGYDNPADGIFYTKQEWKNIKYTEWAAEPGHLHPDGYWLEDYTPPSTSIYTKRLDTRGNLEFNTNWVMAFGRTFKSGALNIPVNVYYSGNKFGGVIGGSVGFNIVTQKKAINQRSF